MSKQASKIAVIGTGNVGASTAFSLALHQMASELVLIDTDREKAKGEAMDISHGLCFVGQMDVYAGDYSDVADCDVIVMCAGYNRKPEETRMDLVRKNLAIAREVTENVMKYYTRGVILVVANPVDVLTYMMQKWSGLPNGRVMGTGTVLDSARFRYILSKKLDVDVKNIHGYIIGEHGESQLPVWSATHIAGQHIEEYIRYTGKDFSQADREAMAAEVKSAGAQIIKTKGATYYAIAVSVTTIVETLMKDQNTIRTVSSVIHDYCGIDDLALSLPSIISSNGVERVLQLRLSKDEEEKLIYSASQIKAILDEARPWYAGTL
jgi:L-lactate dehydrogenase